MTNEILIQRYTVGDCEMMPNPNGRYVEVKDVRRLIDIITDDDSAVVMLARLNHLKRELL